MMPATLVASHQPTRLLPDLTRMTHDELTVAVYASDLHARPVVSLEDLRNSAAQGAGRFGGELEEWGRRFGRYWTARLQGRPRADDAAVIESRFPAAWRLAWAVDAALTLWRSYEDVRPRAVTCRLVRPGGACPVCAERRCADAAVCAAEFANRSWTDCGDCGGSGFDTTGFDIWCAVCGGSRVLEACA